MSHYRDDDYRRSSSRNGDRYRRDSDDGHYNDSTGLPPPYMTTADGARATYDQPNAPVYAPNESLQVPVKRAQRSSSSGRSDFSRRSDRDLVERRDYDYDRDDRDYDRDRDGSRSPLEKSKHALDKAFSTSTAGLATGVIGAIVGGFAVREAAEAATRAKDKRDGRHRTKKHDAANDRTALISTLVGAAVGGLSANAIGKRIEHHREKDERGRSKSRSRSVSRSTRGSRSRGRHDDSDSDSDWSGSSRGRSNRNHRNKERNLVISRSPSASLSRSQSRSREHGHEREREQRKQMPRSASGGAADAYYNGQ